MNRHPALLDLSRDHVTMLEHAKRLAEAAETGPQQALAASRAFLAWHTLGLIDHIEEESTLVLPLVDAAMQGHFQHVTETFRNAADELRITLMDPTFFRPAVRDVAKALRTHVGFCEANLFPELQATCEPAELEALGKRLLAFRKVNRPHAIGERPTEHTYLQ